PDDRLRRHQTHFVLSRAPAEQHAHAQSSVHRRLLPVNPVSRYARPHAIFPQFLNGAPASLAQDDAREKENRTAGSEKKGQAKRSAAKGRQALFSWREGRRRDARSIDAGSASSHPAGSPAIAVPLGRIFARAVPRYKR